MGSQEEKFSSDDIYAYALSKSLTKVSSPATVGLYSSCENRINMILQKIEEQTEKETMNIEKEHTKAKPRSVKPSASDFLALIGRLLFFRPIWTEENQQHHNVRFIYVHFSAWHFAGSDLLWAGLVIRLFQSMQWSFGKLQLALYRVAQYDEEEEVQKKIIVKGPNHWRSKKICCLPLWLLVLLIVALPIIVIVFLLIFRHPKTEVIQDESDKEVNEQHGQVSVLEGLAIAVLGVPAASALRFIFQLVKNLISSQDVNIRKGMDNEQVSKKLGFMNEVRKEMWFMCRFIQFMEIFERRRIRVVLKITNLDRCSPKKIVAVLDAINILLSDEESPFISILAVNPDVLVQKVNFADGCFCKEDRAYGFLNRIVTLAFTVPPLCNKSKQSLLNSITVNLKCDKSETGDSTRTSNSDMVEMVLVDTKSAEQQELERLIATDTSLSVNEEEVEELVKNIRINENINKYMLDDVMSMRRVINSFRVTVLIMKASQTRLPQPEYIAAWVVLANQWPCRLSWIIQCAEDAQQRADIDHRKMAVVDGSKMLWEVFSESRAELYVMSSQIEELLEQDGDPELFEIFLTKHFLFTINHLKIFEKATVNLDYTIKKELAQIRGTSRLRDTGWMRDLAPLPTATIINMETEDICDELNRMKFPSKYIDKVRDNNLNGSALLFGDADELKNLLDMTYGEWATFKLHFLGLPLHLQPHHKTNMPLMPSHSYKRILRVPHDYSPHTSQPPVQVEN